MPTPYIHASTDTNNDLRERRITNQIVNKIERTNSIIKITGEQNLTIGMDNTTYSDILPHCEATNKLQSYVKFVKRICRISNARTQLTGENLTKLKKDHKNLIDAINKTWDDLNSIWIDRLNESLPEDIINNVCEKHFKLNSEELCEFTPSVQFQKKDNVTEYIDNYINRCSIRKERVKNIKAIDFSTFVDKFADDEDQLNKDVPAA